MMKKILSLICFLFTSYQLNAQWFEQNSLITTKLNSVFFIDETTGWACGDSGKIIKTTNGGMNWIEQNSNTISGLNTIHFIDSNYGWACGTWEYFGIDQVLKTTDGGTTWNNYYFDDSTYVNSVQFVNENLGWIIVNSINSGAIFKSTNGGITWERQYQSSAQYESLFFLDENIGWVCGYSNQTGNGVVFKTTNGGNSWAEYNANFAGSPMQIRFVDSTTGWISHNTLGSYGISKTTDGGITWFLLIWESFKFINSISFPNNNIGYAVGFQMVGPPNPFIGLIMKTTDGGSNWFQQYDGLNELRSVFFINENLGWAVGNNGKILYTINGGLPVELLSFSSSLIDDDVTLSWIIATETNNSGFEIQRLKDSKIEKLNEWVNIGFVNGHGTITEPQTYSFVDENLSAGKYQYRLKQIDFDGTFEYSKIVEAEINPPAKFSLEQNYPNPFNPTTSIQYAIPSRQFVSLKVFNSLGEEVETLVNEYQEAGTHSKLYIVNTALPSGVYYYQLKAGEFAQTRKMIILK